MRRPLARLIAMANSGNANANVAADPVAVEKTRRRDGKQCSDAWRRSSSSFTTRCEQRTMRRSAKHLPGILLKNIEGDMKNEKWKGGLAEYIAKD